MMKFFNRKPEAERPKVEIDEALFERCRPRRHCREDFVRMPVEGNFSWVKDEAIRNAMLADYDQVREAMTDFVDTEIEPRVVENQREQFARDLFPSEADRADHADLIFSFELAAYMACKDDKNTACERAVSAIAASADPKMRLMRELFSSYRFTLMKVNRLQPGFGLKCRDLLLGRDIYVIDRAGGSTSILKNTVIGGGIFQFGEHFVNSGCMVPFFGVSERKVADILDLMFMMDNISTDRPILLDSKRSFSLAFSLFSNVAKGGMLHG